MMKKLCCLLLAFALLLSFGCKKNDPAETPDVPDAPVEPAPVVPAEPAPEQPKEEAPVYEINTWPATTPDRSASQYEGEMDSQLQDTLLAAHNSYTEVGYFMEWQLGDGYQIYQTLPGDKDGEYVMWGMQITKPGFREPFLLKVKVTPDGKDFSLLNKQFVEVSEEWKAVQNYRALVTDIAGGCDLLERMGYPIDRSVQLDKQSGAFPTNIGHQAFMASMLTVMTQEMYDAHWADFFVNLDGKLGMRDVGASGFFYAVEMVQPQEDGTYLSYEHYFDFLCNRHDFLVKVELEELPNGTFRVAAWDSDNTALMEQANTAVPIDGSAAQDTVFPVPTGEKLGLTGEDAVLYTALAKELPSDPETLILLSVNLLGSYPGEDGEIHYVCSIHESHFHDAQISAERAAYSSMGGRSYLSRVTIALDGLLEYTYSTLDGEDNTQREKEIFGPLTEACTAWQKNEPVPGARQLLPKGDELLKLYQDAYFSK